MYQYNINQYICYTSTEQRVKKKSVYLPIGLPCPSGCEGFYLVLLYLVLSNLLVLFSEGRWRDSWSGEKRQWTGSHGEWREEKLLLGCIIWEKNLFSVKQLKLTWWSQWTEKLVKFISSLRYNFWTNQLPKCTTI